MDRPRDNEPSSEENLSQGRKRYTKVPKMNPCEVRCGNLSQYEAKRENSDSRRRGGGDIPGKVKSELQKGFVGVGK